MSRPRRGAARRRPPRRSKVPPGPVDHRASRAGLLRAADEAARPCGAEVQPGHRRLPRKASAHAHRQLARASSCADDRTRLRLTVNVVARRDGVIQTGLREPRQEPGLRDPRRARRRMISPGARPSKAVAMLDARTGAGRPHAGRHGQRLRRHAVPRGLRPRPRGRRHRQGLEHLQGKLGDVVAAPIVNAYDDGSITSEWGSAPSTTRASHAEDARHRGGPPARLPLRQAARPRRRASPRRATAAASRSATSPSRA